jgi:hypothetical protein
MFVNIKYLGIGLVVILIIFYIVIMILVMRTNTQPSTFPPETTDCPDYWYESYDKTKSSKCYNTHHLGSNECAEVMDFTTQDWTGSDALCKKQTWATNCGLSWDGITNINHC